MAEEFCIPIARHYKQALALMNDEPLIALGNLEGEKHTDAWHVARWCNHMGIKRKDVTGIVILKDGHGVVSEVWATKLPDPSDLSTEYQIVYRRND